MRQNFECDFHGKKLAVAFCFWSRKYETAVDGWLLSAGLETAQDALVDLAEHVRLTKGWRERKRLPRKFVLAVGSCESGS